MAVDVKIPTRQQAPDMRAYLRSAAQQELDNLKAMRLSSSQTPTSTSQQAQAGMVSPLESSYRVSQQFGNYNPDLYAGKTAGARHLGLDVATPSGTLVKSPFAGIVKSGQSKDFGNFVEVRTQTGDVMRFSHLNSVDDLISKLTQAGQQIQAGQPLGLTGNTGNSTGPHLDIMYQHGGQWVDPTQYEPLKRSLG